MSFTNKTVVITGGSNGIGAATAVLFAKEDANVVIIGRNETNLNKVAKDCEEYGRRPLIIKADLFKDEDVKSVITKTIQKYNRIDVLVNSAAHYHDGTILDGNLLKAYDEVMNFNVRVIVQLTNLVIPYLTETKGNIINLSSIPMLSNIPYFVSKVALDHFTRCAALELAPVGVRVNAVNPGYVRTATLLEEVGDNADMLEEFKKLAALKKLAEPEEIAD
ncbi:3-oxoacyl-[acyl-carrier-protein] reductase FabG-like [Choristoneura fumiferana]|uniref:3-oxoacyl-[acyl-carrier-protein] reductase FabG-like n=1 Tax=Choristoneura fumiferana TaxID=7141 RepID=UPI003D15E4A3